MRFGNQRRRCCIEEKAKSENYTYEALSVHLKFERKRKTALCSHHRTVLNQFSGEPN